jgi:prolyl-tRNA editing enzyme YbaK/EbsC (Cys-tRNA(Pro) deacylase)
MISPRVFLNRRQRAPSSFITQLCVFVDPDLRQYHEVWAAAGTWNDNFGAAPATLFVLLVV